MAPVTRPTLPTFGVCSKAWINRQKRPALDSRPEVGWGNFLLALLAPERESGKSQGAQRKDGWFRNGDEEGLNALIGTHGV